MKLKMYVIHSVYGQINLNADFTNVTLSKTKDGSLFDVRNKLDGEIRVFGLDYDILEQHTERLIEFSLYADGVNIANGNIDLKQYKLVRSKVYRLKLNVLDKYSKFDKFSDTFYNTVAVPAIEQNSDYLFLRDNLNIIFYETGYFYYPSGANLIDFADFQAWTGYDDITATQPSEAWGYYFIENQNGYVEGTRWRVTWAAIKGYGFYEGAIAQQPSVGTWFYQFDEIINGINIPVFYQKIPEIDFVRNVINPPIGDSIISLQNQVAINEIHYYFKAPRRLTDVFQFIVQSIDSNILFDSDSFKYLDITTGESLTHDYLSTLPINKPAYTSNLPFKDLLILPLSGTIPMNDGFEQTERATKAMLNFNNLWKWFEDRGFFWFISDTGYFRLKHYTELSQTDQALFFANRRSLYEITYKEPTFSKVHNTENGSGLDFVGFDTEFNNLNVTETMQYGQQIINVDIDDIRTQKADGYSDIDNDLFTIVATDYDQTNNIYYLRDATGLISGQRKNNSELGFANIQKKLFAPVPDLSAKINGIQTSLASDRLDKLEQIKIENEYVNIDFTKNINIFAKSFEITEFKMKLSGYKIELNLQS